MFALSESLHYFLYSQPTDMRKSFDSLCQLVETGMGRNPLSGEVYVFINRPRNRMKLLRWKGRYNISFRCTKTCEERITINKESLFNLKTIHYA